VKDLTTADPADASRRHAIVGQASDWAEGMVSITSQPDFGRFYWGFDVGCLCRHAGCAWSTAVLARQRFNGRA